MLETLNYAFLAVSLVLITIYTTKYSKNRIRPNHGRVVSIVHGFMFSTTLFGYAYFGHGFLVHVIRGNQYQAFVVLLGILSTIVTGAILQAYLMHITDNKNRILTYPILYSVTPLGFIPILFILMGLHFAKRFWNGYEKAKIKKDLEN